MGIAYCARKNYSSRRARVRGTGELGRSSCYPVPFLSTALSSHCIAQHCPHQLLVRQSQQPAAVTTASSRALLAPPARQRRQRCCQCHRHRGHRHHPRLLPLPLLPLTAVLPPGPRPGQPPQLPTRPKSHPPPFRQRQGRHGGGIARLSCQGQRHRGSSWQPRLEPHGR